MNSLRFLLTMLLFSFCLVSCKYGFGEFFYRDNDVNDRSKVIKQLSSPERLTNVKNNYNILVLSDLHFSSNVEVPNFDNFFNWIDTTYPEKSNHEDYPVFCAVLGDLTDTGDESEYKGFVEFSNKLKNEYSIPVYSIIGNHDLCNSGVQYFYKYVAPYSSYYVFGNSNTAFYFLDTANGTLGTAQLYDLKNNFANDNRRKVVFSHYPIYADGTTIFILTNNLERATLIDLFAKSNVAIFVAGHFHFGGFYDYGLFKEVCLESFNWTEMYMLLTVDEVNNSTSYKLF